MDEKKISIFERHAQTVLMGVVAGLIAWVGVTITSQGKELAIMSEQIKFMNEQMTDLKVFSKQPRFTKDDFFLSIQPLQQVVKANSETVNDNRSIIKALEARIYKLEAAK